MCSKSLEFSSSLFLFALTDFSQRLNFFWLILRDSSSFTFFLRNFAREIGVWASKIESLARALRLTGVFLEVRIADFFG